MRRRRAARQTRRTSSPSVLRLLLRDGLRDAPAKSRQQHSGGSNAAPSRVRTGVSDGGSTSADPRRSGRPPSRAAAASSGESRRSSSAVGASRAFILPCRRSCRVSHRPQRLEVAARAAAPRRPVIGAGAGHRHGERRRFIYRVTAASVEQLEFDHRVLGPPPPPPPPPTVRRVGGRRDRDGTRLRILSLDCSAGIASRASSCTSTTSPPRPQDARLGAALERRRHPHGDALALGVPGAAVDDAHASRARRRQHRARAVALRRRAHSA